MSNRKPSDSIEVFCHEGKGDVLTWDRVHVQATGEGKAREALEHFLHLGIKSLKIEVEAGKCGAIVLECYGEPIGFDGKLPKWAKDFWVEVNEPSADQPLIYTVRLPLSSLLATGLSLMPKPRKARRSAKI